LTPAVPELSRLRRQTLVIASWVTLATVLVGCTSGTLHSAAPSAAGHDVTTGPSSAAPGRSATPSVAAPATATSTVTASRTATPGPGSSSPPSAIGAAAVIRPVSTAEWQRIVAVGAWYAGCPVARSGLRRVEVNFFGFDGRVHRGALVVNADVAPSAARIFGRLFDRRFPIHRMEPIELFGGDDNASMAADNTSAFNCRRSSQANAPAAASPHANGRGVDLNPYENPWMDPRCHCFQPDARYGTRRSGVGVVTKGGVPWTEFTRAGWTWQDTAGIDYQHFDTGYPSHPLAQAVTTSTALAAIRSVVPAATPLSPTTQVVTVRTSGSWAKVTAWTRTPRRWIRVLSTSVARIGARGVVAGIARHQGSYTTPSGIYPLSQAFGISPNPGTRLPYHHVTPDDWWVEDNRSRWYNTRRAGSSGGFDMTLPESNVNGSERLATHPGQYDYAVVIDFNGAPAVRYRGAGIFVHVSNGRATAGCVAVPRTTMIALLRWLDPRRHPVISIR